MSFCPECGHPVPDTGARHCGRCGTPLGGAGENGPPRKQQPAAFDAQPTVSLPAQALNQPPAYMPPEAMGGPAGGQHVGAKPKPAPWKIILPIAACVLLAGAAGAVWKYTDLFGGGEQASTPSGSGNDKGTSRTEEEEEREKSATATTRTSTTRGITTGNTSQNSKYVATLNGYIDENTRLEQQITTLAGEINRVGPSGINSSLLSSISNLQRSLEDLEDEVSMLMPAAGFTQVQSDFLILIGYNIIRADSLYSGAYAWRSGDPGYQDEFLIGQEAKDAYSQLYPVFQQEYTNARSS